MDRPRFVLLRHEHQGVHFDLMFETGSALRTWRLAQPPVPGEPLLAEASFDHRLLYLDYEGPISGNRGHVTRWDAGTYDGDATGQTEVRVTVHGARLCGAIVLRRIDGPNWELRYSTG